MGGVLGEVLGLLLGGVLGGVFKTKIPSTYRGFRNFGVGVEKNEKMMKKVMTEQAVRGRRTGSSKVSIGKLVTFDP